MKPRERYSDEKIQELTSRAQFEELITSVGWVPNIIETDLGQDISVDIYNNGVSSGLSFQVQLKSSSNIKKYEIGGEILSFSFDTDDLKHWFQQINPVYIVLWDTNLRQGWYISIDEAILGLDSTKSQWSSQKTAKIHIPEDQLFDSSGLGEIRKVLTSKALPIFLKKAPLDFKFTLAFQNDDKSQSKHRELIEAFETGAPFELDRSYIQKIDMPDWWVRLMGVDSLNASHIKWVPTLPVALPPVKIEFSSPGVGAITVDYVELKVIQKGTKQAIISNENQLIPYKFWFKFAWGQKDGSTNFSINLAGLDAVEAKKAIDFIRLLAFGGEMRIRRIDTNESQGLILQPNPSLMPNERQIKFINNISRIQTTTGIMIFLPKEVLFTNIDFDNSEKIISILSTGTHRINKASVKFNLIKKDISVISKSYKPAEYYELISEDFEYSLDILSTSIPLGNMKRTIKGKCNIPLQAFKYWLKTAKSKDLYEVELIDVEIIEVYKNYMNQAEIF